MPNTINKVSIIPLRNLPLIRRGDDLVNIILKCLSDSGEELLNGDILVLSQKIVSKAEGNTVDLNEVALAGHHHIEVYPGVRVFVIAHV